MRRGVRRGHEAAHLHGLHLDHGVERRDLDAGRAVRGVLEDPGTGPGESWHVTDTSWHVTDASSLDQAAAPPAALPCGEAPCAVSYQMGEWGECSRSCGGGTRGRAVACLAARGGGRLAEVELSRCEAAKGAAPAASEPCNEQVCASWHWDYSNWEPCRDAGTGLTCGGSARAPMGVRVRGVGPIPARFQLRMLQFTSQKHTRQNTTRRNLITNMARKCIVGFRHCATASQMMCTHEPQET